MEFAFDFSDDEAYAPEPQRTADKLPPLTLGMGAKASVRVDESIQNARRTSDSSRFSIPLIGARNNQARASFSTTTTDSQREETEDSRLMMLHFDDDDSDSSSMEGDEDDDDEELTNGFNFRIGSMHVVRKAEIALPAPARGSSSTSSLATSLRADSVVEIQAKSDATLFSLMPRDEPPDPYAVPPPSPFDELLANQQRIGGRVDMEAFCAKLSAVETSQDHRRIRAYDRFNAIRRVGLIKRSPTSTPANIHQPQTFERLVKKVYKVTPRGEDVIPFCDGVYDGEPRESFSCSPMINKTPVIIEDGEGDTDDDIEPPPSPPELPAENCDEKQTTRRDEEEIAKYRAWFTRHNLDPAAVLDETEEAPMDIPPLPSLAAPMSLQYKMMTPSPNTMTAPTLSSSGRGAMSMFSSSSGATDISRLGISPSAPSIHHAEIVGKLERENERLTLDVRSKTSALEQAVSEMGRMRLELMKLQQEVWTLRSDKTVLQEQVDDLVQSRQRVLLSASQQFDICRRKVNPSRA